LAIWFLKGLKNRSEDLKLTSAIVQRFGVSPSGKSNALTQLEKAGLVRAKRRKGKNPLVTILDVGETFESLPPEREEEHI
jgi:DNA-binding transcriptional ArsR family regulator